MSKNGSFIDGHTVLTQRPRDFEAELERKATHARKRAAREQAEYDKNIADNRARILARIEQLDRAVMHKINANRRARPAKRRQEGFACLGPKMTS